MTPILAAITGIGSVSPYGPLAGLIPPRALEPEAITAWPTCGLPSISGEAISSRQRGAGFENEATGSPVGVGHGGFLTGYSRRRD